MRLRRAGSSICKKARTLRVLLINDYGTASGGAERQMIAHRAGLRERGHSVRLFTSDALLVPGWPIEADVTCRGTVGRAQPYVQSWNPWAKAALARELAEYPPDIVHIRMFLWQLSPSILPLLRDIPTLYQAAVYKAICPNGLKLLPDGSNCNRSAGAICLTGGCVSLPTWISAMSQLRRVRKHWGSIDRVVALSGEMATVLEANAIGPVAVVQNGVAIRQARLGLGNPPVLAYAGRLSREKGVDVLIDAFAIACRTIATAKLLIAGDGPLEPRLRQQACDLGVADRVVFLGYLPECELEKVFDEAWAQAVPSLWREPFGNVATEAMMRGTAVIASRLGGLSEIVVDNETGLLISAGDAEALACAITAVLGNRAFAEKLGDAGRQVALAQFSRTSVLDRFEAHYDAILAATKR